MEHRTAEFLLVYLLPFLAGGLSACLLMRWIVRERQ